MPTNPYFRSNFEGRADQRLLQDLTIETIKLKGRDILYIPRNYVAFDAIFGEDKLSAFSRYYEIEMYIANATGFEGQREIMSKFHFEVRDEIRLQVSRERFNSVVVSKETANHIERPREGDLLFFPLDHSLFEITFAENEAVYYELGKIFLYELTAKRFELGSEQFDTGVEKIDILSHEHGNTTEVLIDTIAGTFEVGEIVYQGADVGSGTFFGEIVIVGTDRLILTKVRGDVDKDAQIKGVLSNATCSVTARATGEVEAPAQVSDPDAANTTFASEDNNLVIDRTTKNPMSYGFDD